MYNAFHKQKNSSERTSFFIFTIIVFSLHRLERTLKVAVGQRKIRQKILKMKRYVIYSCTVIIFVQVQSGFKLVFKCSHEFL